jgi:Domain of unknown function (DUF5615)
VTFSVADRGGFTGRSPRTFTALEFGEVNKRRREEQRLEVEGWFPLSEDLWRQPKEMREKLRLLADTNVPLSLVEDLRSSNVSVATAQERCVAQVDDSELMAVAKKEGRVLLTKDADFWSDDKFPMNRVGGVIFLDSDDTFAGQSKGSAAAFWWAKSFGGGWSNAKMRITRDGFYLKSIDHGGKRITYEIKMIKNRIYVREG